MLNIDLVIANEYADRNKRKAKNKTDEESAFHFNAFVPVMSDIWKLDGLDRQPQKICMNFAAFAETEILTSE